MKPQIVIGEQYTKIGFKCWVLVTILVWLVKLVGEGQWPPVEDVFTEFVTAAFTCLWLTIFPCMFIGGFKRYFAFRDQILEDGENSADTKNTPKTEGKQRGSTELIKLQRSIESLAVDLTLLQQQVSQIMEESKNKP